MSGCGAVDPAQRPDDDACRVCAAEGFRRSPRGFCDGCEEHVSFLERTGQVDG